MIFKFSENCPCGKCDQRTEVCHANCGLYRKWKAELDKAGKELREKKYVEDYNAHAKLHAMRYNNKENIWKK